MKKLLLVAKISTLNIGRCFTNESTSKTTCLLKNHHEHDKGMDKSGPEMTAKVSHMVAARSRLLPELVSTLRGLLEEVRAVVPLGVF